jgi:hypothetical protein
MAFGCCHNSVLAIGVARSFRFDGTEFNREVARGSHSQPEFSFCASDSNSQCELSGLPLRGFSRFVECWKFESSSDTAAVRTTPVPNASATARACAVSYYTTRFGGVDGGRRGRDNGRRLATGNVDLAAPTTGQLRLWRIAGRLPIFCLTILCLGSALGPSTRVCMMSS